MTASKIDWSLSPAEYELLRRDCEASKVPIAVEDSNAIKRIVGLITKADGRRAAPERNLGPPRQAEGARIKPIGTPPELTPPILDLTTAPLPLRRALSYGQQPRARKLV